jgi:hypothetical protein
MKGHITTKGTHQIGNKYTIECPKENEHKRQTTFSKKRKKRKKRVR